MIGGLRRGEILGIAYDMVEFKNNKIHIKRSLQNSKCEGFKDIDGDEIMLVVSNPYGVPFLPDAVTKVWGRFMNRTKIKMIRFHDLRHSSAYLILSEGVNIKIPQKILGHKDIRTTLNVYSHITEKDDEKASDVFEDLL